MQPLISEGSAGSLSTVLSDHVNDVGGCTVAIVMLSFFDQDDLPGQPPTRTRYSNDVTTFNKIWRAGQFAYEVCVQYGRPPGPGWNNAGESLAKKVKVPFKASTYNCTNGRLPSQCRHFLLGNEFRHGQTCI